MAGLFSGPLARARAAMRDAAFSAAFGIIGLVLALTGLGCLTAALWVAIATHHGVVVAFAVIGIIYLAVGAIFMALAAYPRRHATRRAPRSPHGTPPPPPPREPFVQIAEGFALGMQAGRAARKR